MDFLQTILDEPVENGENTKETTFGPIPSHYCAFSHASGERVLDLEVIVPKPPSKKTMKPFHETLRDLRAQEENHVLQQMCGELDHDICKCPTLG
jgi:hypothetical protein